MSSLLCEEGTLGVTGTSSLSLNSCLLSAPQESINDLTRDGDFRVTGSFRVSLLGICAHHPNCPPLLQR